MRFDRRVWSLWLFVLWFSIGARAQFSSNVQGNVVDTAGATIPKATVTLTNVQTKVSSTAVADSAGVYRFPSLVPGEYEVTATASGFGSAKVTFRLQTAEDRAVVITLPVENVNTNVEVSTQASLLDTTDTRLQYTIDEKLLTELPLSLRNPTAILGITPGVTGGLNSQTFLNNAPENGIDYSASGRGQNGNYYILDGLDVTSNVRPGVINLTPGADMVQEISVQTNQYNVEYGRGAGAEVRLSTKYGTDQLHGFASEYYQYQGFNARGFYGPTHTAQPRLAPYHVNNASFGLGGPIWRSKKLFFFGTYQPYYRTGSTPVGVTYEDPAFVAFAQSVRPNTPETQLFSKYPVSNTYNVTQLTASQVFGASNCGTAAYLNVPCTLPVVDSASLNYPQRDQGLQYSARIDKYFDKDRVYVSAIRNRRDQTNTPARQAFTNKNSYYGIAFQANETHTFSPNLLNEATVAINRIEGIQPIQGTFTAPVVGVTGINQGFGNGFALGDYYQHSYHWRDVVTYIRGAHSFKVGYEGWTGDDTAIFAGPYGQPNFTFTNLINLINDNPYQETNVAYDPVSGKQQGGNYGFSELTGGAFVQDNWKVSRKLLVSLGLRYDNFGNPYPSYPGAVAAPFVLGTGSNLAGKIANGSIKVQDRALNQSINWAFAPRFGASWDITGGGKWVMQGGYGIYRDQITLGNIADILKGNPPNYILPTFFNDGSTARPIFSYGTQNTYPFGFATPTYSVIPLDSKGGLPGKAIAIGAVDVNVKAPLAQVWNVSLQHELSSNLVASVAYAGSHGSNILLNGLNQGANQFGQNVNYFPGDLINTTSCNANSNGSDSCSSYRTYLNKSFGVINYAYNTAYSNYAAFIASVRGRFGRQLNFTGSYTRSQSKDDASIFFPTAALDQSIFYGFSPYDVANRVSIGGSYASPSLHGWNGALDRVTGGWTLGGTVIYQSGQPIYPYTNAPYSVSRINPALPASATNLKYNPGSGDFSASGYNSDVPNVNTSASAINTGRNFIDPRRRTSSVYGGAFPGCANILTSSCSFFSQPSFGQLGNERPNGQFRNPGFAQTDVSLKKVTKLYERLNLELRMDAFNLFNQVNFNNITTNLNDVNFGYATSTRTPRYLQVGATANF